MRRLADDAIPATGLIWSAATRLGEGFERLRRSAMPVSSTRYVETLLFVSVLPIEASSRNSFTGSTVRRAASHREGLYALQSTPLRLPHQRGTMHTGLDCIIGGVWWLIVKW